MKKAYKKEIYEEMFKIKYIFFVGNKKPVNKFLKKEFKDMDGLKKYFIGEAFSYVYKNGALIQCLWLPSRKEIPNLIHEITHCVTKSLEQKGQIINHDTTETAAYLAEYLCKQFLDKKKWKQI